MTEPADIQHNPTPQWVRETLCEDLADLDRQDGKLPSSRTIEDIVQRDLERWQAEQRDRKARPSPVYRSNDPAAEMAAEVGAELYRGDFEPEPQKQDCTCGTCKHCRMRTRMFALLELDPTCPARDFVFRHPAFGRDVIAEVYDYKLARRAYRGKSNWDQLRVFQRRMEDICDRSNGIIGLGNWNG